MSDETTEETQETPQETPSEENSAPTGNAAEQAQETAEQAQETAERAEEKADEAREESGESIDYAKKSTMDNLYGLLDERLPKAGKDQPVEEVKVDGKDQKDSGRGHGGDTEHRNPPARANEQKRAQPAQTRAVEEVPARRKRLAGKRRYR